MQSGAQSRAAPFSSSPKKLCKMDKRSIQILETIENEKDPESEWLTVNRRKEALGMPWDEHLDRVLQLKYRGLIDHTSLDSSGGYMARLTPAGERILEQHKS